LRKDAIIAQNAGIDKDTWKTKKMADIKDQITAAVDS
jgi:hypothetical protein